MNRNPEVDRWFAQADHPWTRPCAFADLDRLEARPRRLEAAVHAWCQWKAGA